MKRNLLLSILCVAFSLSLTAQSDITFDDSYPIETMVMDFFDNPGIVVSNISSVTPDGSFAFFDSGNSGLGVNAGIAFFTGNFEDALGPNTAGGTSGNLGLGGDADIDLMGGLGSNDAVLVEFDFTVTDTDTLHFNYVFGSEEYPEYVGTSFNDAFGFLISGPGISGPFSNNGENIALIPNTSSPVEINTVNGQMNAQFYVDNMGGQHLEYDGYTTPLPASLYAVAGETYHIKMVVADRGDSVFDSGIFLSFNSLGTDGPLTPPSQFEVMVNGNMVEFENTSKYATSWEWDFGNGDMSDERNPAPVNYASSGTYTVTLTTQNYCCTDVYTTTINVGNAPVINTTVTFENNPLACFGDMNATAFLEISGGTAPYTITTDPFVADWDGLSAGEYLVVITDANGLTNSEILVVTQPEEIEVNLVSTEELNNQADGSAAVNTIAGGTAPYSYMWSNGGNGPVITDLVAGDYTVTITDFNGCTMVSTVVVESTLSSVFNVQNDFELTLFPNPVVDQLFLQWQENTQPESIEVLDVIGQEVAIRVDYGTKDATVRFDEQVATGVYFVRMLMVDGAVATGRFVKE